jgi:DinB superfamily
VKNGILWLVFGCMLPCVALGQTEAPKDFDTIKQVLQWSVESAEQALLAATEAMPEEKYSFAPTKGEFRGVRTFAQMAKHVAVVNFMNAAALRGENPAIEIGEHENGADSIKTKTQILKFLKDSFADLRKATGTLDKENLMNPATDPWSGNQVPRLMFVTTGISHPWEMYGQMVIYLRMNGIDPYKNR